MSAHGRTHWIKVYVEMLDDPKVGLLPDAVKWRWVSALLLAGELNEDGFLPDINDAAWRLHTNVETLQGEMRTLAGRGLVELREYPDGGERWFIPAFTKRQEAATSTERSRNLRHRRRQNGDETHSQRNVAFSSHNTEAEAEAEAEADTDTKEKNTSRAKALLPPDGVSPSVWQDFLKHRKAKKAPVTETSLAGIKREADKAGWSLEDALRECCTRGWQSFKADWVECVPAVKPDKDPAIAKIERDAARAAPMPAAIREQISKLKGVVL